MRKPAFCVCEKPKSRSAAHVCRLINAFVFHCLVSITSLVSISEILKPLACLCAYTVWFVPDLVGNPEDMISGDGTHLQVYQMFNMI